MEHIEADGAKVSEELQKAELDSKLEQQEPNGEDKKITEEDYKNAQAFWTKARQNEIAMAERLVKSNPKELENIEDAKLQKKVIENLYGASSLEELKIISPEIFDNKEGSDGNEDDDSDELTKLKRKVQLMEYKTNQGTVKTVIDWIKEKNKELVETIPNFESKLEEEMKYFSSELSIKEKADRAFKLVANSKVNNWEAYLAMQGKTTIKSGADEWKSKDEELYESPLAKAFSSHRKRKK